MSNDTIGFFPRPRTRETTIYDPYRGEYVNIDVSGGVGGIGLLVSCEYQEGGYQFRLSPYFSSSGNKAKINTDKKPKIVSAYSSLSISVLDRPLKDIVAEINKSKSKKKRRD
jgi:hypothetical protein